MLKITKNIAEANAITHGGRFHADEVMATVILEKLFGDLTVYRAQKVPNDLNENVIVYDIGLGPLDHHQKGGNGARENGVPYAACGLIWKKFGPKLVEDTCDPNFVWRMVDKKLIQGIDAIDNNVMPKAEYSAQPLSLSSVISSFNSNWDMNEDSDEAFSKAVSFAEIVFDNILKYEISKANAREIVDEAIEKSEGHIMILNKCVPWKHYIYLSKNSKASQIRFVIYPSDRGGYHWQCVPDKQNGFGQRKKVPEEWKGLNGYNLQKVTGVKTATFCHPAGFVGGAETFEDALALAKIAVEA